MQTKKDTSKEKGKKISALEKKREKSQFTNVISTYSFLIGLLYKVLGKVIFILFVLVISYKLVVL